MSTLNTFETADIRLATSLYSLSIPLSHVTLSGRNGTMGIFHFTDVPQSMLTEFEQGEMRIEPQVWHMYLRRLTSMVRSMVNG